MDHVSARSLVCGLSAVLIVTVVISKAVLVPLTGTSMHEIARWAGLTVLVVAEDVLLAVLLAVVLGAALGFARRGGRVAPLTFSAVTAAYVILAFVAIASGAVFSAITEYPSLHLLSMADTTIIASSAKGAVSLDIFAGFAVVAALILAMPLAIREFRVFTFVDRIRPIYLTGFAGIAIILATVPVTYVRANWTDINRWERRLADNPHRVLALSCLEALADSPLDGIDRSQLDLGRQILSQDDAGASWQPPPGDTRPKNVLMIVMESVGAKHCSLYGSPHRTTPNLDRLARSDNAVLVKNYYVHCANSSKSLMALTTGICPAVRYSTIIRQSPDLQVPLINEVLQDHGFRTGYFHSGYWSYMHRDRYFSRSGQAAITDAETLPGPYVNSWGVPDATMYASLFDWIDQDQDRPFFALAFTIETHHPYVGPQQEVEFIEGDPTYNRYLNAIHAADQQIAQVIEGLETRGLLETTLVIITADHGEAFGEHGVKIHGIGAYDCTMHVPMLLLHPSLANYPRVIDVPRQQIDVPVTVLELLGYPVPSAWQGRNLLRSDEDSAAFFFSLGRRATLGLRRGRYKYHYYLGSGNEELFDLVLDPGEERNLARQEPHLCEEFRQCVHGCATYQNAYVRQLQAGSR